MIDDDLLTFIKSFEGYHDALPDGSCRAYWDKWGKVWTIGWGCTEGIAEGLIWSKSQAEEALRTELEKHERHVDRIVTVDMNRNERNALISFCYNSGPGNLTTLVAKRLNKGDRAATAQALNLYKYSGGEVLPGLVRRRAAEAAMFLTPDEAVRDMPQRVDAPAPVAKALTKSKTIGGAVIGAIGAAGTSLDSAMSVALEGLAETTRFEPLKAVAPHAKSVALALVMVGIAIVIGRRLQDAQTGKHSG